MITEKDPKVLSDRKLLEEYDEAWGTYKGMLHRSRFKSDYKPVWKRSKALRAEITLRLKSRDEELKKLKREGLERLTSAQTVISLLPPQG